MDLTEIIKKQDFFKELVAEKENGTLSNAILFFCEDEISAKAVLTLTALMLEFPTYQLMNEKSAQYVRAASGVDLDMRRYPKGDRIVVADSNEIVAEAYVKPVNLPNKVFLLENFDNATEEAQNKLLKVLEEPPANVFFLIGAGSEDRVLPTIKSRCKKIKILPLSAEEIAQICDDPLARVLGGGYIGKTLALEKQEDLKSLTNFAISIFTEMKNSKQVIKFSRQFLEYRGQLDLILQVLCLAIEDMVKIKCESENLCRLTPYIDELKDLESEFSVRSLCEISKLISTLREKVEFNANLSVAIDNFLLKILEVKYICK